MNRRGLLLGALGAVIAGQASALTVTSCGRPDRNALVRPTSKAAALPGVLKAFAGSLGYVLMDERTEVPGLSYAFYSLSRRGYTETILIMGYPKLPGAFVATYLESHCSKSLAPAQRLAWRQFTEFLKHHGYDVQPLEATHLGF